MVSKGKILKNFDEITYKTQYRPFLNFSKKLDPQPHPSPEFSFIAFLRKKFWPSVLFYPCPLRVGPPQEYLCCGYKWQWQRYSPWSCGGLQILGLLYLQAPWSFLWCIRFLHTFDHLRSFISMRSVIVLLCRLHQSFEVFSKCIPFEVHTIYFKCILILISITLICPSR